METNEIQITLCDESVVTLQSDAPDLDGLISAFVEHRTIIDPKAITVDCEDKDFDKAGFTEVLVHAFTQFKENLKLEEDQYETEIKRLTPKEANCGEIEKSSE